MMTMTMMTTLKITCHRCKDATSWIAGFEVDEKELNPARESRAEHLQRYRNLCLDIFSPVEV